MASTSKTIARISKAVTLVGAGKRGLGRLYRYTGDQTWCPSCGVYIPSREWPGHKQGHQIVEGKRKKPPPVPREPNPDKQRERRRRASGIEPPPDPRKRERLRKKDEERAEQELNDLDTQVAKAWDKHQEETERMAGEGAQGLNGASGALAQAGVKWGDVVPQTREEMQEHLLGGTRAFAAISEAIRNFAQQAIIGQRLHPAIARPIESAADSMAEDRLMFTRAYVILCQIYRTRIEYEDQDGPKPDDPFWKSG